MGLRERGRLVTCLRLSRHLARSGRGRGLGAMAGPVKLIFSKELRPDVMAGDITVSFRLWQRPKVRVGGRYPVDDAEIEVDSVELVPFSAITPEEVRRAGEPDLETLRRRAAHAGPIEASTLLYRVEFHLTGGRR
jgi:hypothetical protein